MELQKKPPRSLEHLNETRVCQSSTLLKYKTKQKHPTTLKLRKKNASLQLLDSPKKNDIVRLSIYGLKNNTIVIIQF